MSVERFSSSSPEQQAEIRQMTTSDAVGAELGFPIPGWEGPALDEHEYVSRHDPDLGNIFQGIDHAFYTANRNEGYARMLHGHIFYLTELTPKHILTGDRRMPTRTETLLSKLAFASLDTTEDIKWGEVEGINIPLIMPRHTKDAYRKLQESLHPDYSSNVGLGDFGETTWDDIITYMMQNADTLAPPEQPE